MEENTTQEKAEVVFKSNAKFTPAEDIHLLPCNIAHTGPARVSTYFIAEPLEDGVNKGFLF
jgi:hypothetical protein